MEISEITTENFYFLDEEKNPSGYIIEKYRGKEIYDENLDKKIIVEDIYDLQFNDLDREDQTLALKCGWAWGVVDAKSKGDVTKAKTLKCYLFRPKQYRFWWNPSKFPAYIGAFGSGKSLILCLKGIYYSLMYPGTRGLLMRATYPQLMDTTIATMFKIFSFFGWESGQQYNHHISRKLIELNVGGKKSEILYRPAKNEGDDIQSAIEDLQSLEIDWAGIDEIVGVEERIFMAVRARIGRWGKISKQAHRQLMVSGNPPSEGSWIHKRWYLKSYTDDQPLQDPDEHSIFVSSTYENRRNLPKDYIESLEASPEFWRNTFLYGYAGYVDFDGEPVFPRFNYETYVSKKPLVPHPNKGLIRGWDLGPTAKNKAVVICQLDPRGTLLVLAEIMMTDPGIEKFGRYVIAKTNELFPGEIGDIKDFADPVAFHISQTDGKSAADILLNLGINLYPGEEKLELRLDAVQGLLDHMVDGAASIIIDNRRCPILLQGFLGGYRHKIIDLPNERFSREPLKDRYSHVHDALQYVVSRLYYVDTKKQKDYKKKISQRSPELLDKRRRLMDRRML